MARRRNQLKSRITPHRAASKDVSPSLLSKPNLLALGHELHNSLGAGAHHRVAAMPVLLVGSKATPTLAAALATVKHLHPVRVYLLGLTHDQRLTFVMSTLYDNPAVYINKTPGAIPGLAQLDATLQAARHFVPIVVRHGTGATLANAAQVAADTALQVPNVATPPSYALDLSLLPPVGDQGQESSCVGWSTGYYYKTCQETKEHHWDLTDPVPRVQPFLRLQPDRWRKR